MSDTPRTDALHFGYKDDIGMQRHELLKLSRTLERELAEARGDVEHLEREIKNEIAKSIDCDNYLAECRNGWNGALATVQRLERELAEAVAAERERCARVSEQYPGALHSRQEELMAYDIAAAIRKGE